MPPPHAPVLLLLSGGHDSAVLLADLKARGSSVTALTFLYGQRHAIEVEYARTLAARARVQDHIVSRLELPRVETSSLLQEGPRPTRLGPELPTGPVDVYVPMRNLHFAAHAASWAEALGVGWILFGFNADDAANFWDCTDQFVAGLNQLLPATVRVAAPYAPCSKAQVFRIGRRLGVRSEETLTCYDPVDGLPCTLCLSCRIRAAAEAEQ